MGSDFYETPNIDRLAKRGMIFTDAYSTSANCAPARACLLSGQYTPRHQVYNVGTRPRGDAKHRRLEHVTGTNKLRLDIVTGRRRCKSRIPNGMFGKWHLGAPPTSRVSTSPWSITRFPNARSHGAQRGISRRCAYGENARVCWQPKGKPWCLPIALCRYAAAGQARHYQKT